MIRDLTQIALSKAVDAAALRHRAISNNIANVETPGYTRQAVSFEDELKQALEGPDFFRGMKQEQVSNIQSVMKSDKSGPVREDGNNVDIDHEMASMAENTMSYQALLQCMSIKGDMLKAAIYEGKR